jgi:large subunit ribosomal protein L32
MAHPKRKKSKASTRTRRAVYYNSLKSPSMMECPNCGNTKMLHRACASCGHYRGRQVVEEREEAL